MQIIYVLIYLYACIYRYLFQGSSYSYGYAVRDLASGNHYSHREQRRHLHHDGSGAATAPAVTSGRYRVLLPDGRVQTVTYTADDTHGYRAVVTYTKSSQSAAAAAAATLEAANSASRPRLRRNQSQLPSEAALDARRRRWLSKTSKVSTQTSSPPLPII